MNRSLRRNLRPLNEPRLETIMSDRDGEFSEFIQEIGEISFSFDNLFFIIFPIKFFLGIEGIKQPGHLLQNAVLIA